MCCSLAFFRLTYQAWHGYLFLPFLPSSLSDSLLSQSLLFVNADVEQDGLNSQQHPVLDLSWQHVKHRPGHRDPDVKAAPVPRNYRQHVGAETRSCLGNFKGDISQVHHSDAHVLQHGQLLAFIYVAKEEQQTAKSLTPSERARTGSQF